MFIAILCEYMMSLGWLVAVNRHTLAYVSKLVTEMITQWKTMGLQLKSSVSGSALCCPWLQQ